MPSNNLRPANWFKSSLSGDMGNCVEISYTADGVAIRNSKRGSASPILLFTAAEWDAFIGGAKAGEFDRP
jgi:hypothetical protein